MPVLDVAQGGGAGGVGADVVALDRARCCRVDDEDAVGGVAAR